MARSKDLDKALSQAKEILAQAQADVDARNKQALADFAQVLPADFLPDWKTLTQKERGEKVAAFVADVAAQASKHRAKDSEKTKKTVPAQIAKPAMPLAAKPAVSVAPATSSASSAPASSPSVSSANRG